VWVRGGNGPQRERRTGKVLYSENLEVRVQGVRGGTVDRTSGAEKRRGREGGSLKLVRGGGGGAVGGKGGGCRGEGGWMLDGVLVVEGGREG